VIAILARYIRHLAGAWRWIYVVAACALYLNVFVLIVQLFQKVPALKRWLHTVEPPFLVATLRVGAFVVLTVLAAIRFRIEPALTACRRRSPYLCKLHSSAYAFVECN
jgi:hypothetical protein